MSARPVVIVGAGLAGAKAAQTLRKEGFDGRIVLVGDEPERPYLRPPLSKDYLLGTEPREKGFVHPATWYADHDVELLLARRATALDLAGHELTLADGERLGWSTLLLTTGAAARRLSGPGSGDGLAGVHYLRTAADAERLRDAVADGGRRVAIVGAGWIGLEVAAAARTYGNEVTVIGREQVPLDAVIGPELGRVFADVHRAHGVELLMSAPAVTIEGTAGVVREVALADGRRLPADVVVVGIGAVPNTELAAAAGLAVDNGVVVDAHLRASHPDVYAAGDVANAFHPVLGRHLRVEHWANALHGGPAAARAMLGSDAVYDDVPYFYTDQFEIGMEYSGYPSLAADATVVYRGDVDSGEFVALWVAGSRLVAGMTVNVWDTIGAVEELIRSGAPVDPVRLADPSQPLSELAEAER